MRLLNTHTGQFEEKDPDDPAVVYAILSHTWNHEGIGEQGYVEVQNIQKIYDKGRRTLEKGVAVRQFPLCLPLYFTVNRVSHNGVCSYRF